MTADDKLTAIRNAVQRDPGGRGLARDAENNLFTALPDDFASACRSIASSRRPALMVSTGFYIPTGEPPAYETDGPLGAVLLLRALAPLDIAVEVCAEGGAFEAVRCGFGHEAFIRRWCEAALDRWSEPTATVCNVSRPVAESHRIALERPGPAADGRAYNMRGIDITGSIGNCHRGFALPDGTEPRKAAFRRKTTIGIGDGGNEIGMGKIAPDTVSKNVPMGDRIHCRVPTDYLIVAGVSNWGAYALAAGLYVLLGRVPPPGMFDPERERRILEVMVREGPLVDGTTGRRSATVDGLSWEDYARPLVEIGRIVEA